MAFNRVLAAAWLAAVLAGCAQGRDPAGARASAQEAPRAPVATLGPDDGLPFSTTPGRAEERAPGAQPRSPPSSANAAKFEEDAEAARDAGR